MTETLYLLGFILLAGAAMTGVIADGIAKTRTERRAAIERAWLGPRRALASDLTDVPEAIKRFGVTTSEAAAAMVLLAQAYTASVTDLPSRRSPEEVPDA